MNILIIDYESGNLASLRNSLENASKNKSKKFKIKLTNIPEDIDKADKVILPGVGDFCNCKDQLSDIKGMVDSINYFIKDKGKPFLGICVGMQLMAEYSFERGKNKGLALLESEVVCINNHNKKIRVPHMGWNDVNLENKKIP